MNESSLIPFMDEIFLESQLKEEDIAILQLKIWKLLSRRTRLFTMGDSSSVRVEIAQELLSSIYFLLSLYLKEENVSVQTIMDMDENEVFSQAIKVIERKIEHGKQLYLAACSNVPDIQNISLNDTLKSIGSFFAQYDYLYFAHQIPCDIDYQLCQPIPDTMYGIEYINEYLSHLIIENNLINHFPNDNVVRLLTVYYPDYKGLLINLYDPVLTNAIGLTLLHENIYNLNITQSQQEEILNLFTPLSQTEAQSLLCKTAKALSLQIGISDTVASEYLIQNTVDLHPRIKVAITVGKMDGIFMSF